VTASFTRTLDAFGKVDSVFANAGISGPSPRFVDLSVDDWRRVLAVNLDGAFLTLRAGARHLVERGEGGLLVAVSSTAAIHGAPRKQAYAVSKSGLIALVRSLAVELAKYHVRANALLPGWTDTDLLRPARGWQRFIDNTIERTPAGRWADPGEFAKVAVCLADPSLTFHTGGTLVVDGG
jgi:NAD(P)-dependent dehydrogenase (short-subunit alcohol dehydrogenase family)